MNERAVVTELAAWLRPDAARDVRRDPGADPAVGWPALLDCAAAHQLLPALWSALRRAGVQPLPAALRQRASASPLALLEDTYWANWHRVDDLAAQGREVLVALSSAGIPAMPIKGLHALLAGWWPDPAARVMVDIDVLVPETHIDAADAVVHRLGYRDLGTIDPEGIAAHQRPALGRPGRMGSLELHTAPLVLRHAARLPVSELFTGADEIDVDGCRVTIPNTTHALVLAIAHAQLQDDDARLLRLPLRALTDVATLVASGKTSAVDWDDVHAHFAGFHTAVALGGFVVALDELFGVSLPVARRGGREWLMAAWWATDHRRVAQPYRELVTLPRALSAARMERLHGARTPIERAVARVRHVGAGVRRRAARSSDDRPQSVEPPTPVEFGAYMITTPKRDDVRAETLANLAATDWGADPVLVFDKDLSDDFKVRVLLTAHALLEAGAAAPHELFLFFEDDIAVNASLHHNLEQWPPILAHTPGAHFFGSLYDPNLVPHDAPERATSTFAIVPSDQVYGSQAYVLSRATARFVLEHWDELGGLPDTRIPRLAGRVTPCYYHLPSLVQHRAVPSVWGGKAHEAPDYDADWRAPDPAAFASSSSASTNRAATTGPA
jgi:hypothetical protein